MDLTSFIKYLIIGGTLIIIIKGLINITINKKMIESLYHILGLCGEQHFSIAWLFIEWPTTFSYTLIYFKNLIKHGNN